MTDKQIIIDGVDVSGCRAYYKEYDITDMCSLADGLTCKENPNCYYKQLKAKEQECEELREAKKNSLCAWKSLEGTLCPEAQEQLDQLKAEKEELKKQLTILDDEDVVVEITVKQFEEYKKLKQTLTEIKEIALVNSINTCWTAINLCADCDEIKECGLQSPFEKLKEITQKISECEGNDEYS